MKSADSPVLLDVKDLVTSFTNTETGKLVALDGVSFQVQKGRTLGIVGESGCGKSVTSLSVMGLLPRPAGRVEAGTIRFFGGKWEQDGVELAEAPVETMYKVRGRHIAMIFQEPMTALNPVHKIGKQICETMLLHEPGLSKAKARERALDLLKKVGIPAPEIRIDHYPHELSGGMRQRVTIAIALACKPDLLIADEPTTALDVTIQAQILDLLRNLQKETNMGMIFITHDLGVIAELSDDVAVMYAGRVVEHTTVKALFADPIHPYTQGLLHAIPRLSGTPKTELNTIEGMVPALSEMPKGCRFQNRCPHVDKECRMAPPPLIEVKPDHFVACVHSEKFLAKGSDHE